jgi:hypothetical protein
MNVNNNRDASNRRYAYSSRDVSKSRNASNSRKYGNNIKTTVTEGNSTTAGALASTETLAIAGSSTSC